jgi:hypothetical protein
MEVSRNRNRLFAGALGYSLLLTSFLFSTLGCLPGFGQTQSINGSIRGRVTDPAGAAITGAKVTVINQSTGFTRDMQSNGDGYYVFPNLPLGTYAVSIEKPGFAREQHPGIVLNAGTDAVVDAQMQIGSVSTEINVTNTTPVVEPARVDTGRTIDHQEIDNLPLTSRNPYNFILFQPGVSGHPNPELGIPRTLNTNGLLDRVNYQMDGMVDTETDRYGLRLFPISDIYVNQVQTVSNSFAPEFGNTAGDIYNVITASGTNDYHGEFYFIGRPPGASARPILLGAGKPSPTIDLHDYAVNSGGPIKKNKVFIFGGYEHLLRGTPMPTTINAASAAEIGLSPSLLATAPTVQHVQFLDLRVDWMINSKNSLFVRYDYFRNEYPFNTQNGGLNALDAAVDFRDRAHIGGLQLLTTFSPNVLNEFRASDPYRNEAHIADALTGPGPEIMISGVATFNGTQSAGDRFAEKIPSFSDNLTLIKGTHTIKAGFGWQQNNDNQISDVYSEYIFTSIANYLAAKSGANPLAYSQFVTVLGVPGASYKSYFYDFFAQDTWQVRPNLLVIYGARWDRYQAPSPQANTPFIYNQHFRTPNGDWAPRLGFAWSLNPKTVLRVNSGIFYDAPPTNTWYNTFANSGSTQAFTGTFTPSSAGAPAFPNVFSFLPGATFSVPPTIYALTPNFKNAYVINSNVQLTRQLSQNDSLTVGYVNTRGRHLQYLRDMNLINPIGSLADGRPIYSSTIDAATRLYPQYKAITLEDSGANSEYHALVSTYTRRWTQGYQVSASFTWSHTISDAPEANGFEQSLPIEDPTNRERDLGNSLANRPLAFTMSAVLNPTFSLGNGFWNALANNNELTILANLSSGDEQNITTGTLLNGDPIGTSVQRPLYIGRNAVRGPNVYQVDMRYTRTLFTIHERFRTKFLAEANNVFNTRNVTSLNVNATVNSQGIITKPPSLVGVSSVLEGRLIQLGIRADW